MTLYPVRFCQTYPLSPDCISIMKLYEFRALRPIVIICVGLSHQWHHSISDNLDAAILSSFFNLSIFSRALACFGQYGHPRCSPRASSRWSTSTRKRDVGACVKSGRLSFSALVKSSEKPRDEKVRFPLYHSRAWLKGEPAWRTLDGGDCELSKKVCDIVCD